MMKTDDYNDQSVTKDKIRDGNITSEKLADGSVSTDKLPDGAIKTPKIADGNITTSKLAEASVVTSKIADQNVTKEKIADQSVDNSKLSPEAVTYDKLKDKAIITEKLNDRAVTTEKIEEKAITNAKLGDQSVDGRVVREASLETKHFANESVTTEKVARKSITKDKLADNAVDSSQVVDGSIGNAKLSPDSVTTEKIKDGSVTNEKVADDTLGIEKFDAELRKTIQAATGLPDDLTQMIQDVDQSVKQLHEKDTELQSQIDDKQQQITANDGDISLLQTRSTQMEEAIKSISASGGASQASAVTYENTESGLDSVTAQGAIDELANKKLNKENIAQEFGDSKDKVVSQFALPFREIESPEFIKAIVDAEDHFLFGIQLDGSIEWGKGIPAPIRAKLQEIINQCQQDKTDILEAINAAKKELSARIAALQEGKVDKEEGKSLIEDEVKECFRVIENEEFIKAIVDAEDKVLFGFYRATGKPYYPLNEMYHVIQNEEYFAAWVTTDDKIVLGIRRDGQIIGEIHAVNALKQVISQLQSDVAALQEKVGTIDTNLKELLDVFSLQENPEYLTVEQDAEGKVLSSTNPDGSHYLYKVKSETIPEEFSHIEDPEGRTEITTDTEDKILGYRDSEGIRHEYKLHVNSLFLSSQGLSDFEQKLKESGFVSGQGDWSEKSNLQIAEPRCAIINITSSDDKKAEWAVSKYDNKKYWMQFFDMNGNYFKKRIIFNAQGNSSMAFEKKNGAIDICNDEWIGDDTFSLKIGNWVAQDSFHLKSYYFDFFKGAGVVSYKIIDEVDRTRPFYVNKPWKKAYIKDIYRDNDSIGSPNATEHLDNLSLQIDNGARCVPDGFPCIVYLNGDFYGVYAFCLKKHRDNYHMNKSVASNIHLDGDLNESTLFGGSISWGSFEIRNPKNLVYKTPIRSFTPNDKDSLSDAFLYDADKAQAEIAGDVNIQAYDSSKQYSLGDYVTYNKKVFMAIASSQGVSPTASKKAKDVFKDAASNGNWIDITFTNTVKSSIQRLSNSMSDITSASVQSEKFEEYFDKENLIDYELVQCALHDVDSQGFNWQIITYDGNKWYFCNYDKERVFGQTGSFNMLSSVPTEGMFIIGSGKGTPNEWVINNCKSELKERWEQLVRLGIFTEEHFISLYNDWMSRIGEENYKLEYEKWVNSPCNRDSMVNISDWKYDGNYIAGWTNWGTFGRVYSTGDYVKEGDKIYQALSDNVNKVPSQNPDVWKDVTYNSNKQYNPDDIVWQGVDDFFCFKCLKQTTGVAPISAFYDSYPRALGYHDNIWRLQSYISKNFEVMNKFINNIK